MGVWWGSCQKTLCTCSCHGYHSPGNLLDERTSYMCPRVPSSNPSTRRAWWRVGRWPVLVPDGLPSPSVSQKQERVRWLRGKRATPFEEQGYFSESTLGVLYLVLAGVLALEGREFATSALATLKETMPQTCEDSSVCPNTWCQVTERGH